MGNLPPTREDSAAQEESVDFSWIFVGMFGVTTGWIVSCGVAMWLPFLFIRPISQDRQAPNLIAPALAFAGITITCLLIFVGLTCWAGFSIIPADLPLSVRIRWRWATLVGSLAYWLASWLIFFAMSQTDMLGLVRVLGSVYNNPSAEALVYLAVVALGVFTGSASMAILVLPQWWVIRNYVRRAGRWPAAMTLCNGAIVGLLYAAFADIWRFGGWN